MTSTATTSATELHLGADAGGSPLTWHLTDDAGRPQHGLLLGPSGAGGTTALHRLGQQAHRAGLPAVYVDTDRGPDHTRYPFGLAFCGTDDELAELTAVAGPAPAPGPRLVLVDGGSALRCAPHLWERLLRQADRLRVSVVARVHSLAAAETGSGAVRDLLLAHGQYLTLGRPMGRQQHLVRALLHGYTAPARRQEPGQGVYGYRSRTVTITVARPQSD